MITKHKVLIVGAGMGGAAMAALLSKQGMSVTLLEAQSYAGGCAATFFHKGYRFDAGATLAAGFYPAGPMDRLAEKAGISAWDCVPASSSMLVHLPSGKVISRDVDEIRDADRNFGLGARKFFEWQQKTATAMWDLAIHSPAVPPSSGYELAEFLKNMARWAPKHFKPSLLNEMFGKAARHYPKENVDLRQFIDGQLLISAQALSHQVNALYAAAALDLPRRGVVEPRGGMGGIIDALIGAAKANGADIRFKQKAIKIKRSGAGYEMITQSGEVFFGDVLVLNLTQWNANQLFQGENVGRALRDPLPVYLKNGHGAFVLHVGLERKALRDQPAAHQQVIIDEPLGEGNSIFISTSPKWDHSRAPDGHIAVTISTHTSLQRWRRLVDLGGNVYQEEKLRMSELLLKGAEVAIPGIRKAARLVLSGTPLTYQRYTGRVMGWVGGYPQTSLFALHAPRGPYGSYLVGDSIFPGQSVAAVALGALRVSKTIIRGRLKN